mmetsp:Transcript_48543/g.139404  ORF Transcript_48543/g.139404 Transcript_48543/m.139404 type:complete len:215 (+) Transcript_48543:1001-1645(+)
MASSFFMTSGMPSHISATNLHEGFSSTHLTLGVAMSRALPVTALKCRSPSARETAKATGGFAMVPKPCACARRISRIFSSKPWWATRAAPSKFTICPPACFTRSASDFEEGRWSSVRATVTMPPCEASRHSTARESPIQAVKRRVPVMKVATKVQPSGAVRNLPKNSSSSSSHVSRSAAHTLSSVQYSVFFSAVSFFSNQMWNALATNSAQRCP